MTGKKVYDGCLFIPEKLVHVMLAERYYGLELQKPLRNSFCESGTALLLIQAVLLARSNNHYGSLIRKRKLTG